MLEERLSRLRAVLSEQGVDAMIVPRSDEHQNEYVAPADERLRFASGFSGTAGTAAITQKAAALFTDGRYTLQAQQQVPKGLWQVRHSVHERVSDWLASGLAPGARVGFDPRLHRATDVKRLRDELAKSGLALAELAPNPIDRIWSDRPSPPMNPITLYPEEFAGEAATSKYARVAEALAGEGLDGLVISAPDNLAWLLNIRGADLDMLPVVFGHAIVTSDGRVAFYIAPDKVGPEEALALTKSGSVRLEPPEALDFAAWAGKTIRFDAATASAHQAGLAEAAGVTVDLGADPVEKMKACKNAVEIAGMRAAHRRDAVAVTQFLRWFAEARPEGATEQDCVEALEGFRKGQNLYQGPSFRTISATGQNAAQAHYQIPVEGAGVIRDGDIYLTDSGGQYLDGTTDITRVTVAGAPTEEMKLRYTQVLRGHLALLRQRFPQGIDGAQLDSIARQPLWQEGVDFDHGTGHGIGHYLSVHEGPQSISKRGRGVPLCEGMVVSIEPGYYKEGAFGIRIENLAVVRAVAEPPALAERPLLEFEILTYVPYERALIAPDLLREDEVAWIDAYHRRVCDVLTPGLAAADLDYLGRMTAPMSGQGAIRVRET